VIVDLFLVYQFVRRLATPFDKWEAYKLGIIDEKGKVLIKRKNFTMKKQEDAWGRFDILVANIKKLLGKVPGGSSRIASYAAALYLIKEHKAFTEGSTLTESMSDEDLEAIANNFYNRYDYYNTLAENVNQNIHPAVIKAYKNSRNAEHRDGEYGTTSTRRAVTRTANTLSKKIKQHHPDLDMQGKINLRTQLQNMKEDAAEADDLEEARVRWKKAGPNGEIQATIGGKKYQIEKSLDHNERHKGEWKVMVWDKRRNSWEWETTEYGKANAKDWIMNKHGLSEEAMNMRNMALINKIKKSGVVKSGSMSKDEKKPVTNKVNTKPKLEEEPANNVGSGNIAGMDGSGISQAAQKRWTSKNKSKKKNLRNIIGNRL